MKKLICILCIFSFLCFACAPQQKPERQPNTEQDSTVGTTSRTHRWYDVVDDKGYSCIGSWQQLIFKDGDTIISNLQADNSGFAHKIEFDKAKRLVHIQHDSDEDYLNIDTILVKNGAFFVKFKNNGAPIYKCKMIDRNKALWSFTEAEVPHLVSEYYTKEKGRYKHIEATALQPVRIKSPEWRGNYEYYLQIADNPPIFIDYNLEITADSCIFTGNGHMTEFRILCTVSKETKDCLTLAFFDFLTKNDPIPLINKQAKKLVKLYCYNGKYYLKSPYIMDKKGRKNVKVECDKQ